MARTTRRGSAVHAAKLLLALCSSIAVPLGARADAKLTPIATTGHAAPGVQGATLTTLGRSNVAGNGTNLYRITGKGRLAFAAGVEKGGDYATGVWLYADGALELALEPSFQEVEGGCSYIREAPFPLANGQLVLLCEGPIGSDAPSLFYGAPRALVRQVLDPAVAAGVVPMPKGFLHMRNVIVREPGIVAFEAGLHAFDVAQGQQGHGVWLWSPTSLRLVLQTGAPAPGVVAQYVRTLTAVNLTASGKVLVHGARTGNSNQGALWYGSSLADVAIAAAQGDPTKLTNETLRLDSTSVRSGFLTDSGVLVLRTSERAALWVGVPGQPLAPLNASDGSRLNPQIVEVSPGGRLAVLARAERLRSPDEGLWAGTTEQIVQIARYDSPLRGMEAYKLKQIRSLQVNDRGHMIVRARIEDASMKQVDRLLRYAPMRGFETVVMLDAVVDDHGTPRAIANFTDACEGVASLAGQVAYDHCLDDEGRFAFLVQYSDRTEGLVVTDPMPIGGADLAVDGPGAPSNGAMVDAGSASGGLDAGANSSAGPGAATGSPDSGMSVSAFADTGVDADAPTGTGAADAAMVPSKSDSSGDDGCSVRAARTTNGSAFWLTLVLLAALRSHRRRRLSRHRCP